MGDGPAGVDADQAGGPLQSCLDGVDLIPDGLGTPEGGEAPGGGRERRAFHEGSAAPGVIGRPDGLEFLRNRAECVLEGEAGHLPDGVGHVEEGQRQLAGMEVVVVLVQEQRLVPNGPQARGKHIAGAVMVGGVAALGAVAPAVVVTPVAFVERDAHIFQEVGGPSAPELCQARFRHDGISFGESDTGVD